LLNQVWAILLGAICIAVFGVVSQAGQEQYLDRLSAIEETLRDQGSLYIDGEYWSYGRAASATASSRSLQAALSKARIIAQENIVRLLITGYFRDDLLSFPANWQASISRILTQNMMVSASFSGAHIVSHGTSDGDAWVYMVVPTENLKADFSTLTLRELWGAIAESEENRISSKDSDVYYELCKQFGIDNCKAAWLRSNPELLQPQLRGEPIVRGIRMWEEHREHIAKLLPDLVTADDIKNALILLPYNKQLIGALSIALRRNGLRYAAEHYESLIPQIDIGLNAEADAGLIAELKESLLAENTAVRLIVVANGQFPSLNEPGTEVYHRALAAYLQEDMRAAEQLALMAFAESFNADTINLMGAIRRKLGHYNLGYLLCKQAALMDPNHPFALINMALCHEGMGDLALALAYAAEVLNKSNLDSWARHEAIRLVEKAAAGQ
jgi:tetratricopeptide (TPR) repeat protein